jgi:hypothetical protein
VSAVKGPPVTGTFYAIRRAFRPLQALAEATEGHGEGVEFFERLEDLARAATATHAQLGAAEKSLPVILPGRWLLEHEFFQARIVTANLAALAYLAADFDSPPADLVPEKSVLWGAVLEQARVAWERMENEDVIADWEEAIAAQKRAGDTNAAADTPEAGQKRGRKRRA